MSISCRSVVNRELTVSRDELGDDPAYGGDAHAKPYAYAQSAFDPFPVSGTVVEAEYRLHTLRDSKHDHDENIVVRLSIP